jgi:2-polyprenyl-3-methyl-5-hydroxy-6-metoxy-1,4-benzoquinol methylase
MHQRWQILKKLRTMTLKEHYDNHLGNFYSWYTGDFETNVDSFNSFCVDNGIKPTDSKYAIDLGAGNGIQTIALAKLGFKVKAIDFNNQLLTELKSKIDHYAIEVINEDIRLVNKYSGLYPDLIVCCGDTLPHLDSFAEIRQLIKDCSDILNSKGKLILTFRDYSTELEDTNRFIPVKSDAKRILTCFLEYSADKIRVTDLLHELENDKWIQKVSSYYKTRITKDLVIGFLKDFRFDIVMDKVENRIISIIGQKN